MKKQDFTISTVLCEVCGNEFFIPRKSAQRRPNGHNKTVYCFKCKRKTIHIEKVQKYF